MFFKKVKKQKRIALVNDISGFGRCSMTVALPVISHFGHECCVLPTSILSNHTGYPNFFFEDYTKNMQSFIDNWRKLKVDFDGIATGFLGSEDQILIVADFIREFRKKDSIVLVDPVMADHGKMYSSYTNSMCTKMKDLVALADIITPNLTEACILTDTPYSQDGFSYEKLDEMLKKLADMGPNRIVITGIPVHEHIGNLIYDHGKIHLLKVKKAGPFRAGTGDLFASIVIAEALNQKPFKTTVKKTARFILQCVKASMKQQIPELEGVCFEQFLR